jgi:tetratricopeptide (TPR) repeat protein
LPSAYTALGGVHMLRWDLPEAERLIHHALELNPNEADAYLVLGRICAALGRMDESIAAFERSAELSPLAPRILDNLAAELNFAGRYDEGWKVIERAAALQPDSSQIQCYRVRLLTSLGRRDEALRAVEKLLQHPDPTEIGMRRIEAACALSRFGRQAEAEALVAQVGEMQTERAVGLAYIGHAGEAEALLANTEFGWAEDIIWGSSFDPIRAEPRYVDFLKRAGLEEAQARATAWRIAHGIGPKTKS